MFYIYDSRIKWVKPFLDACHARGLEAKEIKSADDIEKHGYALVFPHAHPQRLVEDREIGRQIAEKVTMVTDLDQIILYEDKRGQTKKWHNLMPETLVSTNLLEATTYIASVQLPIISKADVGASSYNVRYLKSQDDALRHVREVFNKGITVEHCDSLGSKSVQKGYVILQRFIPHETTYRVNVIGRQRAIFHRHCYSDKPMAQTGNVTPVIDNPDSSLLDYVESILPEINSKWVALDILKDGDSWKLLETSLRWPWPSPGNCMDATFFPSGRKWSDMWGVLLDEVQAGAFD